MVAIRTVRHILLRVVVHAVRVVVEHVVVRVHGRRKWRTALIVRMTGRMRMLVR